MNSTHPKNDCLFLLLFIYSNREGVSRYQHNGDQVSEFLRYPISHFEVRCLFLTKLG